MAQQLRHLGALQVVRPIQRFQAIAVGHIRLHAVLQQPRKHVGVVLVHRDGQRSVNVAINWQSFDIAAGESVTFMGFNPAVATRNGVRGGLPLDYFRAAELD